MKFAIWAAAAAAAVVGAAASAQAAEVLVTGSGTWMNAPATPTTEFSAPGGSWSFSFDFTTPMFGVNNGSSFTIIPSDFTYSLNGAPVSEAVTEVSFWNSTNNGLFDITFANGDRVDLYGADVGSSGVPTLGVFSASSDVNSNAIATSGVGSGIVTLAAVDPPAVPEPSTWAMLILGVAMIGYAARRRSLGAASAIAAA